MRGKSKRGRLPEETSREAKRFKGSSEAASPVEEDKQTLPDSNAGSRRLPRVLGHDARTDLKGQSKSRSHSRAGWNKAHKSGCEKPGTRSEARSNAEHDSDGGEGEGEGEGESRGDG